MTSFLPWRNLLVKTLLKGGDLRLVWEMSSGVMRKKKSKKIGRLATISAGRGWWTV